MDVPKLHDRKKEEDDSTNIAIIHPLATSCLHSAPFDFHQITTVNPIKFPRKPKPFRPEQELTRKKTDGEDHDFILGY